MLDALNNNNSSVSPIKKTIDTHDFQSRLAPNPDEDEEPREELSRRQSYNETAHENQAVNDAGHVETNASNGNI